MEEENSVELEYLVVNQLNKNYGYKCDNLLWNLISTSKIISGKDSMLEYIKQSQLGRTEESNG